MAHHALTDKKKRCLEQGLTIREASLSKKLSNRRFDLRKRRREVEDRVKEIGNLFDRFRCATKGNMSVPATA